MGQNDSVEYLVKLGLNKYQAMVYSSLAFLGPSGVAEINRASGVPRTKAYEVLDQLSKMGAVEFRAGRPILYRAAPPRFLIRQLRDEYMGSADEAMKLLQYERPPNRDVADRDLVWTVKGRSAIRRKLSETITAATLSIFVIESYPPDLIGSVKGSLKSHAQRGVMVRAVSLVKADQAVEKKLKFVEYRRLKSDEKPIGDQIGEMLKPLRELLSLPYGLAVVDNVRSFVYLPDQKDQSESLGITINIPGVPMLQRILFEDLLREQSSLQL